MALGGVTFITRLAVAALVLVRSVLAVGAVRRLRVVGQHVVVHVDGGAVVDGVAEPLGHDSLAGVGRQAQQEEARLRRGEAVDRLRQARKQGDE